MLLVTACLFATATAASVTYDRRQDGDYNAQVDVSNVLFLFAIPNKLPPVNLDIFDFFSKNAKPLDKNHDIQERSDIRVMEAFVEPSTPYRVEIGSEEGQGRAAEVVIAGRRRLEAEQPDLHVDDLKLLGATENCGPGRIRDSVTLMCKDMQPVQDAEESDSTMDQEEKKVENQPSPQVVLS